MFQRKLWTAVLLTLLLGTAVVRAQEESCSAQVQAALTYTDTVCDGIGRNQACYGNQLLDYTAVEDAADLAFDAPGDLVDLTQIGSLRLSQLVAPDEWGVAMLQIQANLPDTLPGQNVAMLLFGQVEIDNAGGELPTRLSGTLTSNANLRGGPGTNFAVMGAGANGAEVEVEGRNADSTWFRIRRPDDTRAWVFGNLISIEGDVEALPVLEGDEAAGPLFGPMQAFTFRTGLGETRCDGAPRDGILVQTPAGAGKIQIQANQVDIRLGSTAFLRAIPGDGMTIDVIEGQGTVTAQGTTIIVPAGARAVIPLDDAGLAAGPPELAVYTEDDVADLPVSILPQEIEIAAPLDESALAVSNIDGFYMQTADAPPIDCNGVHEDGGGTGFVFRLERTETGLRFYNPENGFSFDLEQSGPTVYTVVQSYNTTPGPVTYTQQFEMTSATTGVRTVTVDYDDPSCDQTFEYSIPFVRADDPDAGAN